MLISISATVAASLTLAAETSPAAGRNTALRSGVMEEETTMKHSQDQGADHQADPVHVLRSHSELYRTHQVTNAIGVAAELTASEVRDVTIQVRKLQNLVAATSRRELATQKLVVLRSLTFNGDRYDVTAYVATEAQHARCVVHGLPKDIPDDQLLSIITIEDRQILAARRIGYSETILLTMKGATVLMELENQFSALQDSTLDPQPEPRPRSGSLPGYTTKRPTPPPPPKPKTPSYLQALLSQKPPTPSEGPPRKQPRQSPSDKGRGFTTGVVNPGSGNELCGQNNALGISFTDGIVMQLEERHALPPIQSSRLT
ncbi:hypothetical protein HPB51_006057 [Rhipicephalus microplus]|uniref:Uncharacterized protein n=1 Tax=Rhipicephalus microplus TaxID=6941 RepID=A0A9J6DZ09_RHIMP|nr:hypothetical protein HPB51_006057 [Rhipicephalus microplus]